MRIDSGRFRAPTVTDKPNSSASETFFADGLKTQEPFCFSVLQSGEFRCLSLRCLPERT